MTAKPNGARKRRLALQHGLCHWCDKPLVVEPGRKGKPRNNIATDDHVFPRKDPRRYQLANSTVVITKVIACFACNNERGNMSYDEFLKLKRPEWRNA